MKYLKQFFIILLVSFMGEALKIVLPFPVPASIYGMVLMFTALCSGILKLDQVKETGDFLIEIMPVMFIPAGVGLLEAWDALQPVWIPVTVIMVLTTIIVMVVSGLSTQFVIRKQRKNGEERSRGNDE